MSDIFSMDDLLADLCEFTPAAEINPSLDRVEYALDVLGNPQNSFPTIHITGTNGKTSTTRMIDSLLIELGFQTGRFTSPHLIAINERIAVNDQYISDEDFIRLYQENKPVLGIINDKLLEKGQGKLTFFEVITILAYVYFSEIPIDVGIIEVGLGGRWDATNVIESKVAVFTPIDLDHTRLLGNSIEVIAKEKLGIVKALPDTKQIVISGRQKKEIISEIISQAESKDAILEKYGVDFEVVDRFLGVGGQKISLKLLSGIYDDIFLPLFGEHQADNAAVALAAVEAFTGATSEHRLDIKAVRNGLASVKSPGRLEPIASDPTILIDAAHNPAGARSLVKALETDFNFNFLVGVISIFADKDVRKMLEIFEPIFNRIVVTQNSSPRAMLVDDLYDLAAEIFGEDRVYYREDIGEALDFAESLIGNGSTSNSGSGVVVTGSIATIGEARSILEGIGKEDTSE